MKRVMVLVALSVLTMACTQARAGGHRPPLVVTSPPVVSYYYSPPVVSYYSPPVVSYYSAPVATSYSTPVTVSTYRYGLLPRRTVTTVNYGPPVPVTTYVPVAPPVTVRYYYTPPVIVYP